MPDYTGKDIGRYHIKETLGEGGMANVYRAYDSHLDTDVAVKFIRPEAFPPEVLKMILKRFEREARVLARLNHAAIMDVMDYGESEGAPYLVMRLITGGTLKKLMGKPVPYREAARLLAPVARGLEYAHRRGILHRDVKPANIMITDTGDPILTDFGIARMMEPGGGQALTSTGMGIGTPEYMSPEQGKGMSIDVRADVYSLGVVFYELVTGRRPYEAPTPMAVIIKAATEELPRPRDTIPDLPLQVERVIRRALAKNPEDRYPTMNEFADLLEKIADGRIPIHEQAPEPPVDALSPTELEISGAAVQAEVSGAGKSGPQPAPPPAPPAVNGSGAGSAGSEQKGNGTPPTLEKESEPQERSYGRRSPRWLGPAFYSLGGILVVGALFYGILFLLGKWPAFPIAGVETTTSTVAVAQLTPTGTQVPSTAPATSTFTPEPTATGTTEPTPTPTISPTPSIVPTITPKANYLNVAISEVMANPCGGDKEQLANEYIELYNYGDSAADVSDWYVFVTGQAELPDPLVAWETRNPGTKVGSAITNTTVILPGQYALILQPGYLTVESEHSQVYTGRIPANTVILTIGDNEVRLGNKINGMISSGKGVVRDSLYIYRGEKRRIMKLVTTYGIYTAGPDPSVFARIPGLGLEAQRCSTVVRKFPSLPDDISNWQVLEEASPGY